MGSSASKTSLLAATPLDFNWKAFNWKDLNRKERNRDRLPAMPG
jgi:hypothetical protein